ncbi:hypothetical protein FisN_1Hh606 [Fistulifera solaris]|uniref:SnoaL-like domain-containing protein n=1 Tax=Fistulifera solaris TaxID=1519565 RepID=A0A1Z5KQL0_FISSO|nr:hypothetical protein FisN_1Hh606 [Fistulifera solaris]|eukprot:GAX28603.1 hypothetical protein FisN_1Hh606 [Fistulifera solaris]
MTRTVSASRNKARTSTLFLYICLHLMTATTEAFLGARCHYRIPSSHLKYGDHHDRFDDKELQQRLTQMRIKLMEAEIRMLPKPNLSPKAFVMELLETIANNGEPLPDAGFRSLIRASTPSWKRRLYHSVAAPPSANLDHVASALGEAMARTDNQFAILVGEGEKFRITFPTDTVDYGDGTSWVECRLRGRDNDKLLVMIGWQLVQREDDGAWLVDSVDWQDFRDQFRPGIGREEWMRICG